MWMRVKWKSHLYLSIIHLVHAWSCGTHFALPGVSDRQQRHVLQDFKRGDHKILIATSVAEEGLDIQSCNLILRYNYSTNEIEHPKTKACARQKDSQMVNITSDDHRDVQNKEEMKDFRERKYYN